MSEPSPNGDNGRDHRGRFTPGNPGGPGNPSAKAVARWRQTLVDAVTPERVRNIVNKLLDAADAGEPWAVKEVLDRTLGRPMQGLALVALTQSEEADALPVSDAELLHSLRFEVWCRRGWDPQSLQPLDLGIPGIRSLLPSETPEGLKEKQRQRLEQLLEVVESWERGTPRPESMRPKSLEVTVRASGGNGRETETKNARHGPERDA